jgi:hypothetical protein
MAQQKRGPFQVVVRENLKDVKGRLSVAAVCTLMLACADLLRPWPLKIIFDYVLFAKKVPHSLAFLNGALAHGKVWSVVVISSGIIVIAVAKSFAAYSQTHIV